MIELMEASARLGRPADAADAVRRVTDMARATGTDRALGDTAHARALASEGQVADDLFR
ncbi:MULTISPECIES: hypothetical protein [Streptomyces]|uniref:Uncharacterized protein n=2 Tax=Streptomyces TaxID=1883 RepID=A0ABV9J8T2_9ACTN